MRFNNISTVEGIKKTIRAIRLLGGVWNSDGYYDFQLPRASFNKLLEDPYIQETYFPHMSPEAREKVLDQKEVVLYGVKVTSYELKETA